jgi:large subunit ribosomal protein L24
MHIRKGDMVQVMSGDDKGKRGRVLHAYPKDNKVIVEGINRVYKHVKPNRRNPQGGRLSKEMPISVANVMIVDPTTNRPTRIGIRILPDGSKERYAKGKKGSGVSLGAIAPKSAARARAAHGQAGYTTTTITT